MKIKEVSIADAPLGLGSWAQGWVNGWNAARQFIDDTCDTCGGTGEREINQDGADVPVICGICGGTGKVASDTKGLEPEDEAYYQSKIAELEQTIASLQAKQPVSEAHPVPSTFISVQPYRGAMAGMGEKEVEAFHRSQIERGLRLITAWVEGATPQLKEQRIKLDTSKATDYLEAFGALLINTTSLQWAKGLIEVIGEIQAGYNELDNRAESDTFLTWLVQHLANKKQEAYGQFGQMRENCMLCEAYLESIR